MGNKINWFLVLGVVLLAFGILNTAFQISLAAPEPLDALEVQTEADGFIPLLAPAAGLQDGEIDPAAIAPTLAAPLTSLRPEVSGGAGLVPDRLVIPAIFLDAPILAVHFRDVQVAGETYHQWRVPAEFAAGWQDESALLGLPGNTVLNGHHNAYGEVFRDLVELKIGDEIRVFAGGNEFRYLVAAKLLLPERGESLELRMENARWLALSEDERLTLVTCWPADSNTHRVVIVAFPSP